MFLQCHCQSMQSSSTKSRAWGAEQRTVIEPVPEAVEAILNEVLGGPEVKPGINCINLSAQSPSDCPILNPIAVLLTFVDDALKADHGEQAAAHGRTRNQA